MIIPEYSKHLPILIIRQFGANKNNKSEILTGWAMEKKTVILALYGQFNYICTYKTFGNGY